MKVLVGALESPEGRAALDAAAAEARLRQAELLLAVHVASTNDAQTGRSYATTRQAALAAAEALAQRWRDEGIQVTVHAPADTSTPSEAILQIAERAAVDLVVIGVRRRSRVGKLVLGSNAQDILLGAAAPVLAVKPSPAEDPA